MSNKNVRRGYVQSDEKEFNGKTMENLENVISSDAIVLEKSITWFNLVKPILEKYE